jgi:hypothetical protein
MFRQGRHVDVRHSIADLGQCTPVEDLGANKVEAVLFVVSADAASNGEDWRAITDDADDATTPFHRFTNVAGPLELQPDASQRPWPITRTRRLHAFERRPIALYPRQSIRPATPAT